MAFKKPNLPKATEVEQFINKAGTSDYSALTLDELANEYESIDRQSQMLKGRILLEARNRFASDNEFGDWVVAVGLSDTSRQTRNVYMNFARFFQNRDMTGISLTAAYEISRPQNSDIADKIYDHALKKNLPVSEIKAQIQIAKGVQSEVPPNTAAIESQVKKPLSSVRKSVMSSVNGVPKQDAIKVLQDCIKQLRADIKALEGVEEKNNEQSIPASEDAGT